jgi:hypothetical protein
MAMPIFKRAMALLALMSSTAGTAIAAPTVITFDELATNTVVTNQYASQGVLISSSLGDVTIFSSCCANTAPNSLNGAGFREVIVDFVNPADGATPAVTDFFQMTLGDVDITGNGMTAYDIDGNQIAQILSSCVADFACPGSDLFETLSLSVPGMARIVIAAGGQFGTYNNGVPVGEATVDTFVFNAPGGGTVPEPTSLALLGIALVAGTLARRRGVARQPR